MGNFLRLLILWLLSSFVVVAQHPSLPKLPVCETLDLTAAQRQELNQKAALALAQKRTNNAAFVNITYVPIRPHILRRSDGTGGMSLSSINQVIATTNNYYLLNGYGIQFYFCGTSPDYVDNDAQYDSFSNETAITQGHDVTNALNQYYVHLFASGAGGYSYYPSNNVASTRSFILNLVDNEEDMGNRLVPHELGHIFNLVHTFGERVGDGTLGSGTTLELVTRGAGANCTIEGDYVCDTPADPYNKPGASLTTVGGCVYYDPNSSARDANGQAYTPSVENIMSYYFPCTHNFTSGQYDRMQAGLALRQTHTAYSLDCPPTNVATPTNVTATIQASNVLVTWQDNATNEIGYFIERSTSPTSNFLAVGGVGPNTTTFTDSKIAAYTVYYYRVRPSNSTTTGISQTATVRTPACHPTYTSTSACIYGDGLSGLAINGAVLSQNSGCSTNGYGVFNVTSATVAAGQSYSLAGTLLSQSYAEGVTIWADLNRDGIFDTSQGENLFQTPNTVTTQFSGTLTLPLSLSSGQLTIRVVVAYEVIPSNPCGTYSYGETEDYVLTVVNPTPSTADLSLSLQISNRTPTVNQPISYSLTMRNNGPANATGISWQNRLPPNLNFVSGDANIINSGTAVSGSNLSLVNGTSITFVYQLQPTQAGTFINAAQILASNQPDTDSQPGSGTGDGQDDEASVDVRTVLSSSTVYISPNPNQTPLPPVSSNQPVPDPAKADLSLVMAISQRTPVLGQPITCTITISNAGGLTATNIIVRDTLRGLTLTTVPTGMSVVNTGNGYTIIEGKVASLAGKASAQLIFTAMTTTPGYMKNAAQIWSVDNPDPDSKPGSTTPAANNINGEDDVAWADFRVISP
ncbi:GEVED domain-containing protein [Spirosoma flavum]|uniref:GEVED domain-containing protein n=1 Tax=Spirosoma flavum TaxID=2048557 RepID=A0ABW6ACR2_9BACT